MAEGFTAKISFGALEKLYDEIHVIEEKLKVCFEEANVQEEH